jgi:hypothetical protein
MASPLKITFPANLPKNEKDLICMLLAGRLKDLLNGRLVCAQLAIDDLIKDTTGISALGALNSSLLGMRFAVNDLKSATGYDNILHGVNQAMGQVNNVFSLGGLCPSPVHAPMIPDLLAQLNSNLFGQAGNILNALGRVSNPSMCLGGGPGGFGINWNSMPGDLKNLKAAIKQAKDSNLGITPALNAFNRNLKSQASRLKSEVKRLEQNLADPLGVNDKLNTSRNLQRVKSISDGYPVKDSRGILHDNVLKTMVSADVESVIDNIYNNRNNVSTAGTADNIDNIPIKYVTKPILDYCGDVVGYEKVAITGNSAYIGWDPNSDPSLNTDNPTVNPIAGYDSFKYTFKQQGNAIIVYDNTGEVVSDLMLSRGIAYRLNFELIDTSIKLYSDSAYTTSWTEGLTYSRNPAYGKDMEIITPDSTTTFVRGEVDWAVLIENPTTPDIVYWKTNDSLYSGSFIVSGDTAIPIADRTYDLSMAVKKACLQLIHQTEGKYGVQYESTISRTYNAQTKRYDALGNVTGSVTDSSILTVITDDTDITDGKIISTTTKFNDTLYLLTKRYVTVENGLEYSKIYYYISSSTLETDATFCIFIKFDNPLTILNSSKLPYVDHYSYKLTRLSKIDGEFKPTTEPISNSDDTTFELIIVGSKQYIRWNLTSYSEADKSSVQKNDFILQTDIEIDPTDTKRTFIDSNPVEYKTYFYFKFGDGTAIDSTIISNGDTVIPPAILSGETVIAPSPGQPPSPPTPTPVPIPVSSSSTAYGLSLIFG